MELIHFALQSLVLRSESLTSWSGNYRVCGHVNFMRYGASQLELTLHKLNSFGPKFCPRLMIGPLTSMVDNRVRVGTENMTVHVRDLSNSSGQ